MLAAAVALVVALAALGVWALTAPGQWRGEGRLRGDERPLWFPFSEPVWRGVVRSYVIWVPCTALFLGGSAVAALSPLDSAAYNAGMAAASLGLFGGAAIHLPILFFNRPKALVPPSLRDEPGALEAWRARRRGQRA
jgi:hypothetical protein